MTKEIKLKKTAEFEKVPEEHRKIIGPLFNSKFDEVDLLEKRLGKYFDILALIVKNYS